MYINALSLTIMLYRSALDHEARRRATTVYLCEYCIPMLPHLLADTLCSLNAAVDRYCVSVVWEMTPDVRASSASGSVTL